MTGTCRRGHPRTHANTRIEADGYRRCLDCKRAWDRERRRDRSRRPGLLSLNLDDVAVERAVAGDLNGTMLSAPERREAVRRLTAAGYSARVVAEHVKATPRTVHRIRARLRETR